MIPAIIHQIWEGRTEPLPEFYARLSETWKEHYPAWNGVYLIPDKYVTPFDVKQARSIANGADTDELNNRLAEAYAVHYFLSLWLSDNK